MASCRGCSIIVPLAYGLHVHYPPHINNGILTNFQNERIYVGNGRVSATGYASQHISCLYQARINREGCARKSIWRKMVGIAEVGVPISQDWVAVHPDCWCVCLCYLHFAPENPEDGEQRYDIWVSPRGHAYMPMQTGGGDTQPERSTILC